LVGLSTDDDETAYKEVSDLAVWCQELIVDYRNGAEDAPIHFNRAVMEGAERSKFLGVHITKE
jgi:hypothetical protein